MPNVEVNEYQHPIISAYMHGAANKIASVLGFIIGSSDDGARVLSAVGIETNEADATNSPSNDALLAILKSQWSVRDLCNGMDNAILQSQHSTVSMADLMRFVVFIGYERFQIPRWSIMDQGDHHPGIDYNTLLQLAEEKPHDIMVRTGEIQSTIS